VISRARAERTQGTNQAGFALIEAVLVVALLGMMATLSLARYQSYLTDRSLQNAAYLLQADLRLAQQAAVDRAGSGPRVEMCFRKDGYDIYAVDYQDPMARAMDNLRQGATIKVANARAEYAAGITVAVDATATAACFPDARRLALAFSSSGAPLYFSPPSAKVITATSNGRAFRVTIEPNTGRATVSR
jgi:type II secretory pathway pseudopilin PulG